MHLGGNRYVGQNRHPAAVRPPDVRKALIAIADREAMRNRAAAERWARSQRTSIR